MWRGSEILLGILSSVAQPPHPRPLSREGRGENSEAESMAEKLPLQNTDAAPRLGSDEASALQRYSRQMRYAPIGEAGQQRLAAGRVLICGCGALGSVVADTLVRAGVGYVRIVDRDFLELNNLQRQVLFDEQDVADHLPKAVAAANKLRRINSQVTVEPIVADVDAGNIEELACDVDVLLDGTDNFDTRFLLNDLSVKQGLPWIYGGCLGAEGQTMTILPGESACLRCLLPEPPPAGVVPTCETGGILASIVNVIASIEACEAIKLLSGQREAVSRVLTVIDLWDNRMRQMDVSRLRQETDCPTCKRREFPWLNGKRAAHSAVLCGRNAVQLSPPPGLRVDLERLAAKLAGTGRLTRNAYLLRLAVDGFELTIFPDGRAIVTGTNDPAVARSLYARYVGN
jgi:molybdopterin-synthase adenylyltransferase